MKIALVCDWFLPRAGGIELHLRDLAAAFAARGIEAHVITTTPGEDVVDGVRVHRIPSLLVPGAGVAVSPGVASSIGAVLDREAIDLVHSHASVVSPTAYAGLVAATTRRLPAVITFHSMLHASANVLAAADALLGWSRAVVVTAVSSVVAAQLAREMPAVDIGILGNGIHSLFWRRGAARGRRNGVRFVTAMRLTRKKRPLELVRAFAEANRFIAGSPPISLTIAGDGPDRDATARLSLELGIGDRVRLIGHCTREALRDLYADSDVFVLPSERESFGIAALEARAAGLPVIAMLATGARDFLSPGVHGLLARDHAELARFISRMALEPALRRTMEANNQVPVDSHDWQAVVDDHLAIYRTAAVRRSNPPAPTKA